jgi:hypothetical protein
LKQLANLKQLQELGVSKTSVTETGAAALQKEIPGLVIKRQ